MAYENTAGMPFTGNLPFKGSATVNGEPINRSNAGYKTIGGYIDSADSNNSGLVAYFGLVVSSLPSANASLFVIGCPSGYIPRGIIAADNAVLGNEPAKSGYMLQGIPVTIGYEGTFRFNGFSATQTNASASPQVGYQAIFRATSAGTGAAPIGTIEFIPAGQALPTGWLSVPGYIAEFSSQNGVALEINFDVNADNETSALLPYGIPFVATATLTSAAAATPITLLADTAVPAGKKVYIQQALAKVNGGTLWATTATVVIQDSAAVAGVTYAVAGLTANAFLGLNTANVTVAAPISTGVGFTAAKGLLIVGNANGTGSDLVVTVTGFIR